MKLRVPEADAARAMEILRGKPAAGIPDAAGPSDETFRCPRCGSTEVRRPERPRRIAFLMALLFACPAWFGLKKWQCVRCGHLWKP